MSIHKSIEELISLYQEDKLSLREVVILSEYGQEYVEWLLETGLSESDNTALLFLEKKEHDIFLPEHQEVKSPLQIALV